VAVAPARVELCGYASAERIPVIVIDENVDHPTLILQEWMSERWGAEIIYKSMRDWEEVAAL
jgi:hypothetical protein